MKKIRSQLNPKGPAERNVYNSRKRNQKKIQMARLRCLAFSHARILQCSSSLGDPNQGQAIHSTPSIDGAKFHAEMRRGAQRRAFCKLHVGSKSPRAPERRKTKHPYHSRWQKTKHSQCARFLRIDEPRHHQWRVSGKRPSPPSKSRSHQATAAPTQNILQLSGRAPPEINPSNSIAADMRAISPSRVASLSEESVRQVGQPLGCPTKNYCRDQIAATTAYHDCFQEESGCPCRCKRIAVSNEKRGARLADAAGRCLRMGGKGRRPATFTAPANSDIGIVTPRLVDFSAMFLNQ